MKMIFFLFFLSLKAQSGPINDIKILSSPEDSGDYEHLNKGCPENSECDVVLGQQILRWQKLITGLKSETKTPAQKALELDQFRSNFGIPVDFYTTQKSQLGFKPLLFESPCKNHNPKNQPKTLKGSAFIKSVNQNRAIVWRDQTQIEVPLGEELDLQKISVEHPQKTLTYYAPLGDQPLFIKNKKIFLIKEEDHLFYFLSISPEGSWRIENLSFELLNLWEAKRTKVQCPKNSSSVINSRFEIPICKLIWDEDLKRTVLVRMHLGCEI
jgi:hypothetical protein